MGAVLGKQERERKSDSGPGENLEYRELLATPIKGLFADWQSLWPSGYGIFMTMPLNTGQKAVPLWRVAMEYYG